MKKIICLILLTLIIEVGLLTSVNARLSEKIIFEGYKNFDSLSVDQDIDDEIISTSDKLIVDVVYVSDFKYNLGDYNKITFNDVNEIKSKRIKAGKEYHSSLNKMNSAKLPDYNYHSIYLASYFPVISIEINSLELVQNRYELLNKIAEQSDVLNLFVKADKVEKYEEQALGAYETLNVWDEMQNGTLTGNGVKIGILDTGIVDKDKVNFENTNVVTRNHWLYIESIGEHATCMAALCGGEFGVAPNASIYSVEAFRNLSGELDWLIEQEVDVVNMSIGTELSGEYNSHAALVDYMIWAYGITACIAAGNCDYDDTEMLVSDLGMAYNGITIGISCDNNLISNEYAYNTLNGVDKPTICSYGSSVIVPRQNVSMGGSSVSTAFTTGIVALLMELDPTLKLYPQKVTAILTASSYYFDIDNCYLEDSGLDLYVGSGVVDFERAKECVNNIIHYQYNGEAESLDILSTNNVSWSSDQLLRMSISWLAKSTGSVNSLQNNNFDIAIQKISAGEVACTQGTTGTLDMINYYTEYGGTHKVRILISGDVEQYGPQDVFICWSLRPIE